MYKNFEQMRIVMFDPSKSNAGDERKQMKKSASVGKFASKDKITVPQT
jgi:hypothetical protein